jgi:apolipoprotein N-acyltransferase
MTNDAWFGDTKAPFMHLQSAVFRTIENRRALVRAANTGVSCFIDPWGRIGNCVKGQSGEKEKKTYISGYVVSEVAFSEKETFYTKFGDVFAIFCFGCILMGIAGKKKEIRDKDKS